MKLLLNLLDGGLLERVGLRDKLTEVVVQGSKQIVTEHVQPGEYFYIFEIARLNFRVSLLH